jgi:ribonuclease III
VSRTTDRSAAEAAVGHQFADATLLERALVHDSLASESSVTSNETLEFLGDAVIHLVVAEELMRAYPEFDEGKLSRARASLVSTRTLAHVAATLDLGSLMRLGKGEEISGGRSKPKLLAACYEAVIGAVFRDGGYDVARAAVVRHFGEMISQERADDDYKTRLQEISQSKYRATPSYRTIAVTGPDHARRYHAEVEVDGAVLGTGEGTSRKSAEQLAAAQALTHLQGQVT